MIGYVKKLTRLNYFIHNNKGQEGYPSWPYLILLIIVNR
jgi:hypothetical protein